MAQIFISYSRVDEAAVRALVAGLETRGISVWMDRDDIAPATQWRDEIEDGIVQCEALVAVISPDHTGSPICRAEVDRAAELGKRIVPVVRRDSTDVPSVLADRNWIFCRDDVELPAALDRIQEALLVDADWAKAHARLLDRALVWQRNDQAPSSLLRGTDLTTAESDVALDRPIGQPQVTAAQREFVRASRIAATRRQRRAVITAIAVAAVSVTLAAVALVQYTRANTERDRAEAQLRTATSRAMAARALQQYDFGEDETGLLVAAEAVSIEPTNEALDALLVLLSASGEDDGVARSAVVELRSAERPDAAITTVQSADGRLQVGDGGRTLTETATGETQTLIDDAGEFAVFLRDVTFSPDSSRLVVTNLGSGTFDVYDVSNGVPAPLLTSIEPGGAVWGAAFDDANQLFGVFSPDHDGGDLTVGIWDADGSERFRAPIAGALPDGFDLNEALVRVAPEGGLAAIVSPYGEVQLISTGTAQLVGNALPAECSPTCLETIRPDARDTMATFTAGSIETIDAFATARTFDVDPDRWIQLACETAGRAPTPAERERFWPDGADATSACDPPGGG